MWRRDRWETKETVEETSFKLSKKKESRFKWNIWCGAKPWKAWKRPNYLTCLLSVSDQKKNRAEQTIIKERKGIIMVPFVLDIPLFAFDIQFCAVRHHCTSDDFPSFMGGSKFKEFSIYGVQSSTWNWDRWVSISSTFKNCAREKKKVVSSLSPQLLWKELFWKYTQEMIVECGFFSLQFSISILGRSRLDSGHFIL